MLRNNSNVKKTTQQRLKGQNKTLIFKWKSVIKHQVSSCVLYQAQLIIITYYIKK